MSDFEANQEGFPEGLRHCISEIRKKHPNIQHIGVWHALVSMPYFTLSGFMLTVKKLGYWGGISPTGKLAQEYKTRQVRKRDSHFGGIMTVIDVDDVHRFYADFYRYTHGMNDVVIRLFMDKILIHFLDFSLTQALILSRQTANSSSTNLMMLKIGERWVKLIKTPG